MSDARKMESDSDTAARLTRLVRAVFLSVAAIFFVIHFLHLGADFPNHSRWVDWSKYTDEGWYGDAAIRHYTSGHWYFAGDFNPAVALPVWPALELVLFHFTGVSIAAARALTLCIFGMTMLALYALIRQHTLPRHQGAVPSLAAPLAVLLLCVSPFLYVFERMAILEPLMVCLTVLALLAASHMVAGTGRAIRRFAAAFALALLLPAMVLTKTTAIFLFPAIAYMVWARAGYRVRSALRIAWKPAVAGLLLWAAYFVFFVRPRYLADYEYLFSANAYTGIALEPLAKVVLNTFADGMWIGQVVYAVAFIALALALFWRPRLFRNPLVPSLLLWICGYFVFLAYHNNLQPRYYLVLAVPITAFVSLALDEFQHPRLPGEAPPAWWAGALACAAVMAVVLAIAIPDAIEQISYVRHPSYEFSDVAAKVAALVRADRTHPRLILSISGSDITMMTGVPSIDDDFGTLDLTQRVAQYRPGWYIAWNQLDDDKADALTPLYHVERVAAFPALDDADRNLLIVYRLDPTIVTSPLPRNKAKKTPRPLVTRIGQQPTTTQLQH